jgi:hypothetical protein
MRWRRTHCHRIEACSSGPRRLRRLWSPSVSSALFCRRTIRSNWGLRPGRGLEAALAPSAPSCAELLRLSWSKPFHWDKLHRMVRGCATGVSLPRNLPSFLPVRNAESIPSPWKLCPFSGWTLQSEICACYANSEDPGLTSHRPSARTLSPPLVLRCSTGRPRR